MAERRKPFFPPEGISMQVRESGTLGAFPHCRFPLADAGCLHHPSGEEKRLPLLCLPLPLLDAGSAVLPRAP